MKQILIHTFVTTALTLGAFTTANGQIVPFEPRPRTEQRTPRIAPEQKQNLQQLKAMLEEERTESEVTQEQKDQLRANIRSILQNAQKPSEEAVANLQRTVQEATADGEITPQEFLAVQSAIEALLTSANISPEAARAVVEDFAGIVEATNLEQAELQAIVAQIEEIVTFAQENNDRTRQRQR